MSHPTAIYETQGRTTGAPHRAPCIASEADASANLPDPGKVVPTDQKETIGEITVGVRYHRRAVQRAVDELVAAGFVTPLATAPASYRAPLKSWGPLLGFDDDPPLWRYWHQLYAFGAGLSQAAAETADKSLYLQSSRGRDVIEGHRSTLGLCGISIPTAEPGEEFLKVLSDELGNLTERVGTSYV